MLKPIVIVGAGHAGIQLADSLRNEGVSAPIEIFSAEKHLPYQRPPLSKDFLTTEGTAEPLPLRPEQFFNDSNITLNSGISVTEVDRHLRCVKCSDGRSFTYQHL